MNEKIKIYARIFDPAKSVFKTKSTDRVEYSTIHYSNSLNCPLSKMEQCTYQQGELPRRQRGWSARKGFK